MELRSGKYLMIHWKEQVREGVGREGERGRRRDGEGEREIERERERERANQHHSSLYM